LLCTATHFEYIKSGEEIKRFSGGAFTRNVSSNSSVDPKVALNSVKGEGKENRAKLVELYLYWSDERLKGRACDAKRADPCDRHSR